MRTIYDEPHRCSYWKDWQASRGVEQFFDLPRTAPALWEERVSWTAYDYNSKR